MRKMIVLALLLVALAGCTSPTEIGPYGVHKCPPGCIHGRVMCVCWR